MADLPGIIASTARVFYPEGPFPHNLGIALSLPFRSRSGVGEAPMAPVYDRGILVVTVEAGTMAGFPVLLGLGGPGTAGAILGLHVASQREPNDGGWSWASFQELRRFPDTVDGNPASWGTVVYCEPVTLPPSGLFRLYGGATENPVTTRYRISMALLETWDPVRVQSHVGSISYDAITEAAARRIRQGG